MKLLLLILSLFVFISVSAFDLDDNKTLDYLSNYGISINGYNSQWWQDEQIMKNTFTNENTQKKFRFIFEKKEHNIFKIKNDHTNVYCGRSNGTYAGSFRCYTSTEIDDTTFKLEYNPVNDNFFIYAYLDSDPTTVYALRKNSNLIRFDTLLANADLTQNKYQFKLPISGCKNANYYVQESECVQLCEKDYYQVQGDYSQCISRFLSDNAQVEYLVAHAISLQGYNSKWWQDEQIMKSTSPFTTGNDRYRFRVEIVQDNQFKIKNVHSNVYCGRSNQTYAGSFRCLQASEIDDTTFTLQYNSADDTYHLYAFIDSDPDTVYVVRRASNLLRIDTLAANADLTKNKFKLNIPITGCLNGQYIEDERCVASCTPGKTAITGDYNLCV